jgi:hypothetical protein
MTTKHKKMILPHPIFILGTQRSGTTLLTRMLSAHPNMFIQNEVHLDKIFTPDRTDIKILQAIKDEIYARNGFTLEEVAQARELKAWGFKDPQLTEHIAALKIFLGKTKFIIIVRDGRAVTNSYMENKWGLGTNAFTGSQRWKREVDEQLAFMQERPDDFLLVRYEDMVDDMAATAKQVCKHIDVAFDPIMLDYAKNASFYGKKRENINTFKQPDQQLKEKWKTRLSPFEISIIEQQTKPTLQSLGYEPIGEPLTLSTLQRQYFILHQRIIGEVQLQYRWRKAKFKDWISNLKKRRNVIPDE